MRLAKVNKELVNKRLATPVITRDGIEMISEGTVLSESLTERLINSGFSAVYIEDENLEIQLKETLGNDKQTVIYTKLQEIITGIEKNEFKGIELSKFIRTELLPEVKNEPVSIPVDQVMDKDDHIQHSINVAILAMRTASKLGLSMERIELVAFISLLHDIGKILKLKDIKYKNVPHYEIAYSFLKRKNCSVLTYMSIRFQDETHNGKGPYRIDGDKLLDVVKILSICDYYENLLRTTNLMPHECFEETQALVNIKFDPDVFKAFRDAIYIYPIGLPICLNNKSEGIIIQQNESYPLRPIVKVVDKYYNLMENLSLFIEKVAI